MEQTGQYLQQATQNFHPSDDCSCEVPLEEMHTVSRKRKTLCEPCRHAKFLLKNSKFNAKRAIKRITEANELTALKVKLQQVIDQARQTKEEADMEIQYLSEQWEASENKASDWEKQYKQVRQAEGTRLRLQFEKENLPSTEDENEQDSRPKSIPNRLIVAPSHYCVAGDRNKTSIGDALYCTVPIPKKELFIRAYEGEQISIDKHGYAALVTKYGGKPEYLFYLCQDEARPGQSFYLDCHAKAVAGLCLASKANCVRNLEPRNAATPPAKPNCEFRVHKRGVKLYSLCPVDAYRELLCRGYGNSFQTGEASASDKVPSTSRSQVPVNTKAKSGKARSLHK